MFFAAAAWVEFGFMAFSPSMETSELFSELSGMHYKPIAKAMKRCEDTASFKKRFGGKSPDHAASCVMGPQLIRTRRAQLERPAMIPEIQRDWAGEEMVSTGAGPVFIEEGEISDPPKWI
jgi:hypothetical protein